MIKGNQKAMLQVKVTAKNEISERIATWHDVMVLDGVLDYQSGESRYTTFNTKLQESTHIFICNYKHIPKYLFVNGGNVRLTAENSRLVVDSKHYDVVLIDDPMELHQHLELYLKYTGGQ